MRLFIVEIDQEEDGRWIADAAWVPGALAYGATMLEAVTRALAVAGAAIVPTDRGAALDRAEWSDRLLDAYREACVVFATRVPGDEQAAEKAAAELSARRDLLVALGAAPRQYGAPRCGCGTATVGDVTPVPGKGVKHHDVRICYEAPPASPPGWRDAGLRSGSWGRTAWRCYCGAWNYAACRKCGKGPDERYASGAELDALAAPQTTPTAMDTQPWDCGPCVHCHDGECDLDLDIPEAGCSEFCVRALATKETP